MPVFFIHDPAQGIITPLDRKFRTRTIDEPEATAATGRIHVKAEPGIPSAYVPPKPSKRYDEDEAPASVMFSNPMDGLCVRDIMSQPALCGQTTQTLQQAWETLQQYEIHHLAIVDDKMGLQGMLSSNQLLHFLLTHYEPIDQVPLTRFCSKTVLSTHPDVRVRDLATALLEQGLDGVPVCQGGQLVGMVTYTDVIKILLKDSPLAADI